MWTFSLFALAVVSISFLMTIMENEDEPGPELDELEQRTFQQLISFH